MKYYFNFTKHTLNVIHRNVGKKQIVRNNMHKFI